MEGSDAQFGSVTVWFTEPRARERPDGSRSHGSKSSQSVQRLVGTALITIQFTQRLTTIAKTAVKLIEQHNRIDNTDHYLSSQESKIQCKCKWVRAAGPRWFYTSSGQARVGPLVLIGWEALFAFWAHCLGSFPSHLASFGSKYQK